MFMFSENCKIKENKENKLHIDKPSSWVGPAWEQC